MCQLLGMNANTPTDVMFSFTGFATRAEEHKDGFGIAFFEGAGVRLLVDAQSARTSPVAEMVRRFPISSENIVAHIRKATQGRVALENTHPFVRELWGRYWVFAHNGDLKDFAPRLHGAFRPVGKTDSERAFCWLMQELAKAHASVPQPSRSSPPRCVSSRRCRPRTAPSTSCSATARRCGRTARPPAPPGAPAPVRAGLAARRGRDGGLRPAHEHARPRRGGRHRAADARRGLGRVRARRAARVVSTGRRSPTTGAVNRATSAIRHASRIGLTRVLATRHGGDASASLNRLNRGARAWTRASALDPTLRTIAMERDKFLVQRALAGPVGRADLRHARHNRAATGLAARLAVAQAFLFAALTFAGLFKRSA